MFKKASDFKNQRDFRYFILVGFRKLEIECLKIYPAGHRFVWELMIFGLLAPGRQWKNEPWSGTPSAQCSDVCGFIAFVLVVYLFRYVLNQNPSFCHLFPPFLFSFFCTSFFFFFPCSCSLYRSSKKYSFALVISLDPPFSFTLVIFFRSSKRLILYKIEKKGSNLFFLIYIPVQVHRPPILLLLLRESYELFKCNTPVSCSHQVNKNTSLQASEIIAKNNSLIAVKIFIVLLLHIIHQ